MRKWTSPQLRGPIPRNEGPAGPGPSLTHLAVALAVQEVIADVGLQHGLPLLPGMGCGQALEQRKAKVTRLTVEECLQSGYALNSSPSN